MAGLENGYDALTPETQDEALDKFRNNPQKVMLNIEVPKDTITKDITGKNVPIFSAHGYGVKAIDDETITLVCSSVPNQDIVLSLDDFKDLNCSCISVCEFED